MSLVEQLTHHLCNLNDNGSITFQMVQEEEATKEPCQTCVPTTTVLQRLSNALSSFTVPDEKILERTSKGFSKSPVQEIDEYFELVAKLGRPLFKWDIIRCAFLWKLEQTMSEMLCIEADSAVTEDDKKYLSQMVIFINSANLFYKKLPNLMEHLSLSRDKYLRALEKNINVVTTITEDGERVTGIESFPGELDISPTLRIEEPFFVQVDECDAPIETKLIAAGDSLIRGNRSPRTVAKDLAIGDYAPINLSPSRDAKDELPEIKQENNLKHAALVKPEMQNAKLEEMEVGD
ncbi:3' exoribonuclease family [Dirofilaria immitis]|nr:3' exoribonuclease family [Dirofilaria immitis]